MNVDIALKNRLQNKIAEKQGDFRAYQKLVNPIYDLIYMSLLLSLVECPTQQHLRLPGPWTSLSTPSFWL